MKDLDKNLKIFYLLFLKLELKTAKIFKIQLKNLKMMKTINFIIH